MTRPALSSADECTAVHVRAQSSLAGCASDNSMMSAVSVQRTAAKCCRYVGAAGCSAAGSSFFLLEKAYMSNNHCRSQASQRSRQTDRANHRGSLGPQHIL